MPSTLQDAYALNWVLASWAVHSTNARSLSEWLVMLTTLVLEADGIEVSISELAEFTGLPTATVSRYISGAVQAGRLSERVDPDNRRRRLLRVSESAKQEIDRHQRRFEDFRAALHRNRTTSPPQPLIDVCRQTARAG